jgi:hypothetical protein
MMLLAAGVSGSVQARAQEPPTTGAPGAADVLFSCRAITDDQARLECYDREVGALQQAQAKDEVMIVKQEEVMEARRDLFGFTLPKIALFKGRGKDDAPEEIKQIEETLTAFKLDPTGRAMFTLSNGARWIQSDNAAVLGEPKPGDKVTIETASLGSFKASIAGRRAIRVRRVN